MNYEAVVLDLFGTLVPGFSITLYHRELDDLADSVRVPRSEFVRLWKETAKLRTKGHFPTTRANIEHVFREMGLPHDDAQVAKAVEIRKEFYRRALVPRPDAVSTLAEIKERGLVVSY